MNLAKYIDHTFLKPNGSPKDIAKLCREAKKFGFASVCVHPCEVKRCAKLLKGTDVAVCTVIGFPLGQNTPTTILYEALEAIESGAKELDFVINVNELKVASAKGDAGELQKRWRNGSACRDTSGKQRGDDHDSAQAHREVMNFSGSILANWWSRDSRRQGQ